MCLAVPHETKAAVFRFLAASIASTSGALQDNQMPSIDDLYVQLSFLDRPGLASSWCYFCATKPCCCVQVMCLAVPHEIKAAIFRFLAAFIASPSDALQLLNRLQAAELVHSRQLGTSMTTQLKAVSEAEEEYSEMIAYVRMMNRLFDTAGASLVLEEQERLVQYTVRCFSCVMHNQHWRSDLTCICKVHLRWSSSAWTTVHGDSFRSCQ
jgi:hypothetical protein